MTLNNVIDKVGNWDLTGWLTNIPWGTVGQVIISLLGLVAVCAFYYGIGWFCYRLLKSKS